MSCSVDKATVVYCDNAPANPVHHRHTKHIEPDILFGEQVSLDHVRELHVATTQQLADLVTKGLSTLTFEEFRSCLYVSADTSAGVGVISLDY